MASKIGVEAVLLTAVLLLVSAVFFTSDLSPDGWNNGITGAVIKAQGDISYSSGYLSSSYDDPYINDPVLFYISIFNSSDEEIISDAGCNLIIGEDNLSMPYNDLQNQYEVSYVFEDQGDYNYEIVCVTQPNQITDSGTISVNELAVDLKPSFNSPGSGSVNSSISFEVSVEDLENNMLDGNIDVVIDFNDSTNLYNFTMDLGSDNPNEIEHLFIEPGIYNVTLEVNPNKNITEIDYENNFVSSVIQISDPEKQPMSCGALSSDVLMQENIYCDSTIWFTESGITLDCNNHRIYGDGIDSGKVGILAEYPVTIKNCVIDNFGTAVETYSGITLINSSIKDSSIGLFLNSTSNNITGNIFSSNSVCISNYGENDLTENDFSSSEIYLDSYSNTNFSNNYHDTLEESMILSKIINNDYEISIYPFYDGSTRDASSELIHAKEDSNFEITLSYDTEIEDDVLYSTIIWLNSTTDQEAECRASVVEGFDFDQMNVMNSQDMLLHTTSFTYNVDKDIAIYVKCKSISGKIMSAETDEIHIKSSLELAKKDNEDMINLYDDEKDNYEDEKDILEDMIDNEDNTAMKKNLQIDLAANEVEIWYYTQLKDLCNDFKNTLNDLGNKSEDISEDISEIEEDIQNLNNNLSRLEGEINNNIASENEDVFFNLRDKYNYFNELVAYEEQIESRNAELLDLKDDHILIMFNKSLKEFEIEVERQERLEDATDNDYSMNIEDIEDDIEDIRDDIEDWVDEEGESDYDIISDMYDSLITINEDYKDKLVSLSDEVDDAASLFDGSTQQKLGYLNDQIYEKISAVEDKLDSLDEEKDFAEENLILDYGNNWSNNTDEDEEVDSVPDHALRIWLDDPEPGKSYAELINHANISFNTVKFKIKDVSGNENYIDIISLEEPKFDNPDNITSFEWYDIVPSESLNLSSLGFVYSISSQSFDNLDTVPGAIMLFSYDLVIGEWIKANTSIESSSARYDYNSVIDYYEHVILGYNISLNESTVPSYNDSDPIKENMSNRNASCEPLWNCTDYGECNEYGVKVRQCVDLRNCSITGSKVEKNKCEYKGDCKDGIKNNGEEGIDCGGPCSEKCAKEEIPGLKETGKKAGKTMVTLLIIVITSVIIIATVFTGVYYATKKKKKKVKKKKPAKKKESSFMSRLGKADNLFDYELVKRILEKLYSYQDMTQMRQEFILEGYDKDNIDYIIQLTNFIFSKVELQEDKINIVDSLKSKGWNEKDAKAIVEFILVRFLVIQLREFYSGTEQNEEEDNVIKEIFKSDNYEDNLIDEAFKIFKEESSKDDNK